MLRLGLALVHYPVLVTGTAWYMSNGWGRDNSYKWFGKNGTVTQYVPSFEEIYNNISAFYDYFMKESRAIKQDYQDFESDIVNLLHSQSVRKGVSDGTFTCTLESILTLAQNHNSLYHIDYWDYFGHENDMIVWKMKKYITNHSENVKWPCLKAHTVIDMPMEKLADLLMDSKRVHLLNRYSAGRVDVEIIDADTKIVWNRTKIPFTVKPYDFCTLMHKVHDKDQKCILILSKAVVHEKVPRNSDYSRSEIIFGMNILRPHAKDSKMTDFTSINHVKYNGIPPFFAWRSGLAGTLSYLKKLKEVASEIK